MTIISSIMDGVVFVDRSGEVALINPVAEELLGVKGFVVIGQELAQITGDDEVSELFAAMADDHARVTGDESGISRTLEIHTEDRDLHYIKIATSEVLDHAGDFAGVMIVLQDITSEYKSDQLRNQYLSIVAHELRTPLTGIKTFSSLMAKGSLGSLTEQQTRAVESIKEQSVRLEHQIDKLINLGYIDSNEYGQDLELMDAADLVAEAAAPFEVVAKDAEVEIHANVTPDAAWVQVDRTDAKRALKALIENAVKFTPEGGSVTVTADAIDGVVNFVVEDTGIGINPRYHRRVFEKFFQIEDPLTRHHGGAGLGLFVAQGILEAHGSRIEVDSDLGMGARFRFTLPVFEKESVDASTEECVPMPSST